MSATTTTRHAVAETVIHAADGLTVTLKLMRGGDGPQLALAISDDDGALALAQLDAEAAVQLAAEVRLLAEIGGMR